MTGGGTGLQTCVQVPDTAGWGDVAGGGEEPGACLEMLGQGRDKEAKTWVRGWGAGPSNAGRPGLWRAWLEARNRGSANLDTEDIYWSTVETCFGSRGE